MKKVIIADYAEYNNKSSRLGNYHYAQNFAEKGYEVLWMSTPWNHLMYFINKEVYKQRKAIARAKRHELDERIYGFAPYSLVLYGNYPFFKSEKIAMENYKYMVPDIKKSLAKIEFDSVDILWISNIKNCWLADVVDYKKLVFRIPDDFSSTPGQMSSAEKIEEDLVERADFVFVTAKKLVDKVGSMGKIAHYLPNGADFQYFQKQGEAPREYKGSKKPKLVYVGVIDFWFDDETVRHLALNLDVDIYLVGNVKKDLSGISRIENVHVLGPRPYDDVPAYIAYADVAIIPFVKSSFTDAINPIKLFEYCSTGTGVVCSDMNEVKSLNPPICIAKDKDEFLAGVKGYLENGVDSNALRDFGKSNSWGKRYECAMDIIEQK